MSEFRRRLMMAVGGGALPYDAELRYLESSGNGNNSGQIINSDVLIPSACTNVEYHFKFMFTKNQKGVLCGHQTASYGNPRTYLFYTGGGSNSRQIYAGNNIGSINIYENELINGYISIDESAGIFNYYRDGILEKTYSLSGSSLNKNFPIRFFGGSSGNSLNDCTSVRIYDFKIIHGDTVVRDFIPVRVGAVGYMFDKVSNELFSNQGTGNFILSLDKNAKYDSVVEYIEGTGTQWIDTGIYFDTTKHGYEMDAIFINDKSGTVTLCGIWQGTYDYSNLSCTMIGNYLSAYFSCPPQNFRAGDAGTGTALGQPGVRNKIGFINHGLENGVINITRYVNGTSENIVMNNPYIGVTDRTFPIFGAKKGNSGQATEIAHLRLYGFKMYEYDNVILDLIPVRIGQKGYLYDRVSNRILDNSGAGDFLVGNDVN